MLARIAAAAVGVVVAAVTLLAGCSPPPPPPHAEPQSPSMMPESAQAQWEAERAAERAEIAAAREAREVVEMDQDAVPDELEIGQGLALARLNTASDRMDAAFAEIDSRCASPTNDVEAFAAAGCIGRVLASVCPSFGEGALYDMSRAARDMDAEDASWLFEQAGQECSNAVFYGDMPNPRQLGAAVTRMGEKIREASALLH